MKYYDLRELRNYGRSKAIKIVMLDSVANKENLLALELVDQAKDEIEVYSGNGELGCGPDTLLDLIKSPTIYYSVAIQIVLTKTLEHLLKKVVKVLERQKWPSQLQVIDEDIHLKIAIPENVTNINEDLLVELIKKHLENIQGPLTQILVFNPEHCDFTLIQEYPSID